MSPYELATFFMVATGLLYRHRTGTDTFQLSLFGRCELFPGTEHLFLWWLKSLSYGDTSMSLMNATPQAVSCISQWALKTPLRGMWPVAAQGNEMIWLKNRGPVNCICCYSVFSDKAPQKILVLTTHRPIHRLLFESFTSGKKLLKTE